MDKVNAVHAQTRGVAGVNTKGWLWDKLCEESPLMEEIMGQPAEVYKEVVNLPVRRMRPLSASCLKAT
jgi:hypothetical protein